MSAFRIRIVCVGNGLGMDEYRASITQTDDNTNSAVVGPYSSAEAAKDAAETYARDNARRLLLGESYDFNPDGDSATSSADIGAQPDIKGSS